MLYPQDFEEILPSITKSEDELVSGIRKMSEPKKAHLVANVFCSCKERDRKPYGKYKLELKTRPLCKLEGVRFLGKNHWLFCVLAIRKDRIRHHLKKKN